MMITGMTSGRTHVRAGRRRASGSVAACIGVVAVAVLAGLMMETEAASKTVLRLGHVNATTQPMHLGAVRFGELVKDRTKGAIEIEVYPAGQLGGVGELFQSMTLGTLDMVSGLHAGVALDSVRDFAVLDAGYLVDSYAQFRNVATSEFFDGLRGQLIRQAGVRVLAVTILGTLHLTANKRVYRPSDLTGLKLRSLPSKILMQTTRGLGGTPTPVAFQELYGALQLGIVDGQTNPIPTIWQMKFHEVQKYLMLTAHQRMFLMMMINEKRFQALRKEHQTAILEAAKEAAGYQDGLILEQERSLVPQLTKAGMTIIGPQEGLDIAAFETRVRQFMRDFEAQGGWRIGLYDEVRRLARGQN